MAGGRRAPTSENSRATRRVLHPSPVHSVPSRTSLPSIAPTVGRGLSRRRSAPVSPLRLDVITDDDGFDALRSSWSAVFDRSADRNVFITWEWARTWWRHFGGRDQLHIVTVHDGDEVAAVAPFLRARIGVGRAGAAMLVGIGQENADYGGVLLGDRPAETGDLIFSHLESEMQRRAVVNLTRLRPDGDALPLLQLRYADPGRGVLLVEEESDTYPALDLGRVPDVAAHLQRLAVKSDVRRRMKRLREHHDVTFEYRADPTPEAMAALFDLSDRRWDDKTGKMAGVFAGERRQAFVTEVATMLRDQGSLRLSFLYADGVPIAARFGFEIDGVYLGFKECFDPDFARYGPSHLMVAQILDRGVEGSLRTFDFLRGEGDHKSIWANTSATVGYWVLRRDSRRGSLDHTLMWNLLRLRSRR